MAFEEVALSEEEKAALGGTFVRFNAIGDKFPGVFVRTQPATGQFAKPNVPSYVFKGKKEDGSLAEFICDPNPDLAPRLAKAALKPGNRVIIQYVSDLDTGKEKPLKQFKLLVDRSTAAPAPKPPPPPADPFDDIPL